MKSLGKFFASVKKEMKKVRWLTKKEMVKYSVAVLTIMIFFGLFFVASDLIIGFVKVLVA
ncbi:MAG: preprotein translocase subunit SecE [Firmicutes bacterium]|nr:preprotein translocase subunit SecE [Bacillota bacterium]